MTIQPSAAFDLRETGLSFADVGKQLGCTKQNAMRLVSKHAKAIGREPVLAKPVVNPGTRIGGSGTWASGPARGQEPRGAMSEPFLPGNRVGTVPRDRSKTLWREYMIGVYEDVASDAGSSRNERMTAAAHWMDRHEGKPVARVDASISRRDAVDFTEDELLALAGEDGGEGGTGEASDGEK